MSTDVASPACRIDLEAASLQWEINRRRPLATWANIGAREVIGDSPMEDTSTTRGLALFRARMHAENEVHQV